MNRPNTPELDYYRNGFGPNCQLSTPSMYPRGKVNFFFNIFDTEFWFRGTLYNGNGSAGSRLATTAGSPKWPKGVVEAAHVIAARTVVPYARTGAGTP